MTTSKSGFRTTTGSARRKEEDDDTPAVAGGAHMLIIACSSNSLGYTKKARSTRGQQDTSTVLDADRRGKPPCHFVPAWRFLSCWCGL
jgi:hypothetical protein